MILQQINKYISKFRDNNLEIDVNIKSKNNIPIIETNDDVLIGKSLSPIKEESTLSIPTKVNQHSSIEVIWEKLLISLPICATFIDTISMPACQTGLTQYKYYLTAKSISNRKLLQLLIK